MNRHLSPDYDIPAGHDNWKFATPFDDSEIEEEAEREEEEREAQEMACAEEEHYRETGAK